MKATKTEKKEVESEREVKTQEDNESGAKHEAGDASTTVKKDGGARAEGGVPFASSESEGTAIDTTLPLSKWRIRRKRVCEWKKIGARRETRQKEKREWNLEKRRRNRWNIDQER